MFDIDKWQEIWITITRNKWRSILTAFGVFWGVFMLIILLGAGNGLVNGIVSNVKDVSTNTVYIWTDRTSEPYHGFKKGRWWEMSERDIPVLISKYKNKIKYIAPIMPDWWGRGSSGDNVMYGDKSGSYGVMGHYPVYNKISPVRMLEGRFINDIDIQQNRKVCLIGETVYKELFAGKPAIGATIKVSGIYYSVVGVMKSTTQMNVGGRSPDESVWFPYTTIKNAYNAGDNVYFLAITAHDEYDMTEFQEDIYSTIKQLHHISPTDKMALGGFNLKESFDMFSNLFLGVYSLIWIVGLGTLISGVVGVSNIMLVTVKERTKEIGIRRALGARPRVIVVQILTESLVLTAMAGVIAICLGVGILALINNAMGQVPAGGGQTFFQDPQVDFGSAVAAMIIIIISGTAAGIMPAIRAMKIKAIEALNEE